MLKVIVIREGGCPYKCYHILAGHCVIPLRFPEIDPFFGAKEGCSE